MAANESAAVAALKTYSEAQSIFFRQDRDGDGVSEFARQLTGDQSLFESKAGLADLALIDASFAGADASQKKASPKAGYVFKILTQQGSSAPGGAVSYLNAKGDLTLGHALVATPASWDGTGRNTFIIGPSGTVYQQDLGMGAPEVFQQITAYNPDSLWVIAE